MREALFDHVNIPAARPRPGRHVRGDYKAYSRSTSGIARAGRIDLQVLGIGRNGHVGFNEPTSSLASRTRVKTLTLATIEDNRRVFDAGERVPECAITGHRHILEAREILLWARAPRSARRSPGRSRAR